MGKTCHMQISVYWCTYIATKSQYFLWCEFIQQQCVPMKCLCCHRPVPSNTSRYYSIDMGLVHFIALDLNMQLLSNKFEYLYDLRTLLIGIPSKSKTH